MQTIRTTLAALFLGVIAVPAAPSSDAALQSFFQEYLDGWFQRQPLSATSLGDHRFDAELESVSTGSRKEWLAFTRRTLEALPRRVGLAGLSDAARVDYEIVRDELQRSIWLAGNFDPFETDPRVYTSYISDSVYLLLAQSTLPRETNVANSIARMRRIPEILAEARENLRNPPRAHLETAIGQTQGAIRFYEHDVFVLAGDTPQLPELKAAAARLVESLKSYHRFLQDDLLPHANGPWRIGKKKFSRKLELTLDAGLGADEVLARALAEFDRVQRDMYVIARQLWSVYFPQAVLPPDDAAGRRETVQRVLARIGQEHGKPENLTDDVRKTVAALKTFIAENDILALPDPDTCQIVEMPEFRRGNSTAYMESPPPLDTRAAAYFAVSPPPASWDAQRVKSYLEEYNDYMNQILSIHEAYPGHYVQLEYANRNPSLIRRVFGSGVYIEGWAVYTEQTMLDQGYGGGSLPLRLTQLKFYLRAVANAILDHRMHCTDLSDEEALRFLMEDAYQSEGEARLKVIRAKQSSVQLSTYFVGRMALYELRQAIQRELGSRFILGRFHEAVLEPGAVPVKYLPALVRKRLSGV